MMAMDTADVRARLEGERKRLSEEIDALRRAEAEDRRDPSEGHSGVGNHIADAASETFEHEKSLALLNNLRTLSTAVERALRKLDEGTYGICDDCGSPIAAERLAAIPYATLCITCKSRRERR